MKTLCAFLILGVSCSLAVAKEEIKPTPDKPKRLYLDSDWQNWDETLDTDYEQYLSDGTLYYSYTNHSRWHFENMWLAGWGGTGLRTNLDLESGWNGGHWWGNVESAGSLDWDWLGYGIETGVIVESGASGNGTMPYTNFPLELMLMVGNEHCEVSLPYKGEWYGEEDGLFIHDWVKYGYARQAQTTWRLETGGRAASKRRSLFEFTSSAWEVLDKWEQPPFEAANLREITDKTKIRINNVGTLEMNGKYWKVLPDDVSLDVTPVVQGKDYYTFTVEAQKEHLDVTGVTFTGDPESYPILCDTNEVAYPGAHWGSDVVTHVVSNKPALYVSGSRVSASVDFAALGGGLNTNLVVRGKVGGGLTSFTLWGTNDAPGGTLWNVEVFADTNLVSDKVDFYNPMKVEWAYAVKGRNDFVEAGQSTNQVYVVWKEPQTAYLFHTVIDVACRNAAGGTIESNIVAGIWGDFADQDVVGADRNDAMEYWGDFAKNHRYDGMCLSVSDLVKYKDGKCGAWAGFLITVLAVHGVATAVESVITTDFSLFLGWNGKELVISESLSGQGGTEPLTKFLNHGVVRYGSKIYDPSYGGSYALELMWEDTSVDYLIYDSPSGDYWRADTKGVKETIFNP
jgi:hypothetical protein